LSEAPQHEADHGEADERGPPCERDARSRAPADDNG